MIGWRSREITTTKIRKSRMFVGILMIWWITQRGRWEARMFTLYISRKRRWNIKWIFNERLVLSFVRWWVDIRCVLQMINNGCIHGWRYTWKIRDGRVIKDVRKKQRRYGQIGMVLYYFWMFKFPVILFMNDNACWLCNTNSIDGLILVHNKCRVRHGRTQYHIIRRIIWVWRWRLSYKKHVITQWIHNQDCTKIGRSDVGRMWQLNRCVCILSHITLRWWSCLMRGWQIVTCDSDHVNQWLCNPITEVCWVEFELELLLGIDRFDKAILKFIHEILKFHLTFLGFKHE